MQMPKVESPEWVVDNMEEPTVEEITRVEAGKLKKEQLGDSTQQAAWAAVKHSNSLYIEDKGLLY